MVIRVDVKGVQAGTYANVLSKARYEQIMGSLDDRPEAVSDWVGNAGCMYMDYVEGEEWSDYIAWGISSQAIVVYDEGEEVLTEFTGDELAKLKKDAISEGRYENPFDDKIQMERDKGNVVVLTKDVAHPGGIYEFDIGDKQFDPTLLKLSLIKDPQAGETLIKNVTYDGKNPDHENVDNNGTSWNDISVLYNE